MRNLKFLMIACLVLFGLGGGTGCDREQRSACDVIDGVTYESVVELECGRGGALCHWTIRFDQGQFQWYYSDVSRTNSYTCDGATIIGQGGDEQLTGTLDFDSGRLTWEGVDYAPEL